MLRFPALALESRTFAAPRFSSPRRCLRSHSQALALRMFLKGTDIGSEQVTVVAEPTGDLSDPAAFDLHSIRRFRAGKRIDPLGSQRFAVDLGQQGNLVVPT